MALAMGAVFLQKRTMDTAFHPMEFFLHKFTSTQQTYSTTDREMLAIIVSLCYWRGYLAGTTFVVHTDHKPLEYFFS